MNRLLCQVLSITLLLWSFSSSAAAAPRTAAEVVALGSASDGQTVELTGEAIGEPIRASQGDVWVNILSGGVALGVVIDASDAAAISEFGRYQHAGSTVRVLGEYNVGCDVHGGDTDVHATSVQVIAPGHATPELPAFWQLGVAAGLFAVAATSMVRYGRARRRYESG